MAAWGGQSNPTDTSYSVSAARPAASRPTTTYKPLADGTQGTLQTLAAMAQAVTTGLPPEYRSYRDGTTALAAAEICGDAADCAVALYEFTRDHISYIDHPWNMQVVQDARRTLMLRSGDCVSKSVLLSTMLASIGITSRFVAQATTPEGFDHVYVEAKRDDGSWLALDPTADGKGGRPLGYAGWTQSLYDGGFEMAYDIF